MLGDGLKDGGFKEHRNKRLEVLERFRRVSTLTPEQEGQWEYFKETWDDEMRVIHSKEWGRIFSEILAAVSQKMMNGDQNAFPQLMAVEMKRALRGGGALVTPALRSWGG